MRFILSSLLCSPALAVSAALPQASVPARPQGLHWQRVEKPLHAEQVDGQATSPHWWVRSPQFKARVASNGIKFVPFLGSQAARNWPLRMSLAGVTVDGASLEILPPTPLERTETRLVQSRGVITERWDFEEAGVEQSFLIEGPHVGELRVAVDIETDLRGIELERGLRFEGPDGGVQLSGAVAIDAAGRKLDLESEWDGTRWVHVIPAPFIDGVAWPLIVDPLIWSFGIDAFGADSKEASSAYSHHNSSFLVVYEDSFSAADIDLYATHIRLDGSDIAEGYLDSTDESWRNPDVASAGKKPRFAVVAEVSTAMGTELRGLIYLGGTSNPGAPFLVEPAPASRPRIGGDLIDRSLVVFNKGGGGAGDVQGRLIFSDGAVGGLIDLSVGAGDDSLATISHSNGDTGPSGAAWCVGFLRDTPSGGEVWAMQVGRDGAVMEPPSLVYQGSAPPSSLTVSSPLRQAGPKTYLITWLIDLGLHDDILACVYRDGAAGGSTNLSLEGLPGASASDDEIPLQVDSAGEGFALLWTDRFLASIDHYFTSLDLVGDSVCVGESLELPDFSGSVQWTSPDLAPRTAPGSSEYLITGHFFELYSGFNIIGAYYATPGSCLGEVYCSANTNSTGFDAAIQAAGSGVAGEPLQLGARRLPPGQFGYFLASQATGSGMPAGSEGNLCLGGTIARFQADPLNSGSYGEVATTVDTTALPFSPPVSVASGETYYFTYWYRDTNPLPTSNFTNGVAVEFQ